MSRVTSSSSASATTITAPVDVNLFDAAGNPITSTGGALNVNIEGSVAATIVNTYAEVTAVPVNVETTIASYLVNTPNTYLQSVSASGSNIGEVKIYVNSSVIDKRYLYYTGFNVVFDYKTFLASAPGQLIANGATIYVKGTNTGQSLDNCSFNATIQVAEVA